MRIYCADFETTVYKDQTFTEVWACACVEVGDENEVVYIFNSIESFFDFLINLDDDITVYFHNLRFDGSFIMYYLLKNGYEQSIQLDESGNIVGFCKTPKMQNRSVKYLISVKNLWYEMVVKTSEGKVIDIRDSLKLLPFTLKAIGESFKTKHQKLDMEYAGERHAGGVISKEEREYIKNDVLVLKEAIEILEEQGHTKLTIGSCCMEDFRNSVIPKDNDMLKYYNNLPDDMFKGFMDGCDYKAFFPNLYEYTLSEEHKYPSAGEYILKSYSGGWCYIVPEKANKIYYNGTTADVNSLYPSMMHSSSGNYFPIGKPKFWTGKIPENVRKFDENKRFYFVRIRCRFELKEGYLPFIRIRNNPFYPARKCLTTSDIVLERDHPTLGKKGSRIKQWIDPEGVLHEAKLELILTWNEYELFLEHYNVTELEELDGCWFYTTKGLFDYYINFWMNIKKKSKGAMRTLAKLFLNNLYGKFASSTNSSFIVSKYNKEYDIIENEIIQQYDKTPGYIPIGSAITSYARCFTVRAAQANYYGIDNPGFIYADTDSIHCDLPADKIRGIKVDPVELSCWKLEGSWDKGIFVRQKTYIEHITHEDGEPVKPYYSIKCAGMGKTPKKLVNYALNGIKSKDIKPEDKGLNWLKKYDEFLDKGMTLEDFKVGLEVPGNLKQKRISGGIILAEQTYIMRPSMY